LSEEIFNAAIRGGPFGLTLLELLLFLPSTFLLRSRTRSLLIDNRASIFTMKVSIALGTVLLASPVLSSIYGESSTNHTCVLRTAPLALRYRFVVDFAW
jgi:hypothetical protein